MSRKRRSVSRNVFPWPWLLWSLWVVVLTATTTLAVLWVWNRTHPCPCETQEAGVALPTPIMTPTQITFPYVVQPGDTLESVAERFGVPVPTLQALNHLFPGPLQPGSLVFVPGTPPADTQGQAQVRIVEVIAPGFLVQERVRLMNLSPHPIRLEGWALADDDGNVFRFPPVVLYPQGSLQVWTRSGASSAVDVYWGLERAVWEPGDIAVLNDAQGREVHRFQVSE